MNVATTYSVLADIDNMVVPSKVSSLKDLVSVIHVCLREGDNFIASERTQLDPFVASILWMLTFNNKEE